MLSWFIAHTSSTTTTTTATATTTTATTTTTTTRESPSGFGNNRVSGSDVWKSSAEKPAASGLNKNNKANKKAQQTEL